MFGRAGAGFTDRHVVVFGRGRWDRVREVAGAHAASGRLAVGRRAPLVFDETGHAILEGAPRATLDRLGKMSGVRVRREAILRRPATRVTSAPTQTIFLDDLRRSWALQALGLPHDANDGAGVVVGLIDSGVDLMHPALAGSVTAATADGGRDASGHGTHCAGVIVGKPAFGQPRFGIAPGAHVRSYRVFDASQTTTEGNVREAIKRAVDDGCHVLVLAAGVPAKTFFREDATLGEWLTARNRILFAAAGNESNRMFDDVQPTLAPANAPDVRAIGAVTAATYLWNASNGLGTDLATRVDAVAPGVNVLSAWPGGRTLHMTGSSVATAIAGGVAAALWSRDRSLGAAAVYERMKSLANRNITGARPDGFGDGALALAPSMQ